MASLHPQHLKLKVKHGTRRAIIHFVVLGQRKSIEERIAELINTLYGASVSPVKKEIRRWLRENNMDLRDVLEQASRRGLIERIIPQLYKALMELRSCKTV